MSSKKEERLQKSSTINIRVIPIKLNTIENLYYFSKDF